MSDYKFFIVTYRPFTYSDMTGHLSMSGIDEADIRKRWEADYPNWQIVSIEEE